MIPRELIAIAEVPGGPPLRLVRHGGDHIIMLERNELMSSRMSGSEEALGRMTCARLAGRPRPCLLVGGYGMGFTLRAMLGVLGPDARVTVAELVPDILDWARGPMAALTGGCLDDPRVDVRIADVAAEIAAAPGRYDAILLDVDNGPDGLTRAGNDGLYAAAPRAGAGAGGAGAGRHPRRVVGGGRCGVHAPAGGCGVRSRGGQGARPPERQGAAACDLVRDAAVMLTVAPALALRRPPSS